MKALDLSRALRVPNQTLALQAATTAYNFEKSLLAMCRGEKLDRVVSPLDDGEVEVDKSSPIGVVPYLILELADGDVRRAMSTLKTLDDAWRVRTLAEMAVGLSQLHSRGVAHQDVKPSNILMYPGHGARLGDLGSASQRSGGAPRDHFDFAGDPTYATPEALYKYFPQDWDTRRLGCDLYHLGSMQTFLFTSVGATATLLANVDPGRRPDVWPGDFATVLPFLLQAFGMAVEAAAKTFPDDCRSELRSALVMLCNPDPGKRGHPKALAGKHFRHDVTRFASLFDLLARRLEKDIVRPRA
ncbi:MAG: hypothetical protein HY275_03790 [Gemmatimonadetes bacterium]|nr:hypothetical protein [Gemmatimonadota bacterium]